MYIDLPKQNKDISIKIILKKPAKSLSIEPINIENLNADRIIIKPNNIKIPPSSKIHNKIKNIQDTNIKFSIFVSIIKI